MDGDEMQTIKYTITGEGLKANDLKHILQKSYEKKLSNHNDYIVDKSLSAKRVQVYHNPNENKTVIAHRGTNGIHDWITDASMSFGFKNNKRFNHSKKIQQKAEEKYKNSNIISVGHSLGSKLAEEASKGKNNEVITLNNPVVPSDLFAKKNKKQTNIRTEYDPTSILKPIIGSKQKEVKIQKTSFNPLKEHSTNSLDRLPENQIIGKGLFQTYPNGIVIKHTNIDFLTKKH